MTPTERDRQLDHLTDDELDAYIELARVTGYVRIPVPPPRPRGASIGRALTLTGRAVLLVLAAYLALHALASLWGIPFEAAVRAVGHAVGYAFGLLALVALAFQLAKGGDRGAP